MQSTPDQIVYKAKAEKYAKIISKTIILSGMDAASFGQNAYFYDAAEGLLTGNHFVGSRVLCAGETAHRVGIQGHSGATRAVQKRKARISFSSLWNCSRTSIKRNGLRARH